ncbi:MAG TPA: hemerythrin domain-containing protein [Anaeromyxobacteraceae bacterium]|nr:hemerythrin domain-containing protein [Anaeromyxobacteraceae bacterium]
MADQKTPGAPTSLSALLGRDHERLRVLFAQLLDEFREGDREELRTTWTAFESGLLAHLAAEERHLFPLFRKVDPEESSALLREHGEFRRTLDELGVGVDLHSVKLDVAQAFVDALTAHGRREDQRLYQWAEEGVLPAGREAVVRALAHDLAAPRGP